MPIEESKLLACPFCGGVPKYEGAGPTLRIACQECGAQVGMYASEDGLDAAWMARAYDDAAARTVVNLAEQNRALLSERDNLAEALRVTREAQWQAVHARASDAGMALADAAALSVIAHLEPAQIRENSGIEFAPWLWQFVGRILDEREKFSEMRRSEKGTSDPCK